MTDQPTTFTRMLRRVQLADGEIQLRYLLFEDERLCGLLISDQVDYEAAKRAFEMPVMTLDTICNEMGIEVTG
jgi:hypothetical protein